MRPKRSPETPALSLTSTRMPHSLPALKASRYSWRTPSCRKLSIRLPLGRVAKVSAGIGLAHLGLGAAPGDAVGAEQGDAAGDDHRSLLLRRQGVHGPGGGALGRGAGGNGLPDQGGVGGVALLGEAGKAGFVFEAGVEAFGGDAEHAAAEIGLAQGHPQWRVARVLAGQGIQQGDGEDGFGVGGTGAGRGVGRGAAHAVSSPGWRWLRRRRGWPGPWPGAPGTGSRPWAGSRAIPTARPGPTPCDPSSRLFPLRIPGPCGRCLRRRSGSTGWPTDRKGRVR